MNRKRKFASRKVKVSLVAASTALAGTGFLVMESASAASTDADGRQIKFCKTINVDYKSYTVTGEENGQSIEQIGVFFPEEELCQTIGPWDDAVPISILWRNSPSGLPDQITRCDIPDGFTGEVFECGERPQPG